MKKNRAGVMLLFAVLLIIPGHALAEEVNALDHAYKEQCTKYNEDIAYLTKSIANTLEHLDKTQSIADRFQTLGDYRSAGNIMKGNIELSKSLKANQDRLKELNERKLELKIKLLEKSGALPPWWTD